MKERQEMGQGGIQQSGSRKFVCLCTIQLLEALPCFRQVCLSQQITSCVVALQVFTESEVRASVVFQLSKLCSLLLKAARLTTGGGAWDALVAGQLLSALHPDSLYSDAAWVMWLACLAGSACRMFAQACQQQAGLRPPAHGCCKALQAPWMLVSRHMPA